MSQLDVFLIHANESSSESQKILDANKAHFSKQCAVIFDLLFSGGTINSHTAVTDYQITDLRRRLCDLRENGVSMSWSPCENGRSKNWYFSSSDKEINKKFVQKAA